MSTQNVRELPGRQGAELMVMARQLLAAAPEPSHVRELALALVRLLERMAEDAGQQSEVG